MKQQEQDSDRQITELFESARREERARTPAFPTLMENAPRRSSRRLMPGRMLRVATMSAAAGSLIAFAAAWLTFRQGTPPVTTSALVISETQAIVPQPKSTDELPSTLHYLGYVGEKGPQAQPLPPPPPPPPPPSASQRRNGNESAADPSTGSDHVSDLPVPGRLYQNVHTLAPGVQDPDGDGNPVVHGARSQDFKAQAGGISNVDPMAGPPMSRVNPNSIDEMEVITSGARAEYGLAQGGFANAVRTASREVEDNHLGFNTESYKPITENEFLTVTENPLSTFSVDVDTASYSNVRRFINAGTLPPADAVRIEELINYFSYDYPQPSGGAPFSATIEIAGCPWNEDHRLARIGLKGRELTRGEHRGSNLVFLIDVSGSMDEPAKLPLLQQALGLLVGQLDQRDQVSIVVYAGSSGLVLPATSGADHATILDAISRLAAGGSTNGGEGLRLAYKLARESFIQGGNNRVILATDGDFNVGVTSEGEMLKIIEKDARDGIFLTVLGVGTGNYKDSAMENLADHGNGNYAYLDDIREAQRVLVDGLTGMLFVIAKDVKLQVEFNPAEVGAYRLIGYENRMLKKEDFNDDRKDAGEIGAGHTVTALYELVPQDKMDPALPKVDELEYQAKPVPSRSSGSGEAFTLKLRYKEPDGDTSKLLRFSVRDKGLELDAASPDFKFAAAVAAFGMALRDSAHKGSVDLDGVRELARAGLESDEKGRRAEFIALTVRAKQLAPKPPGR